MRSMTGYGKGCVNLGDNQAVVELTAVNSRKQVELRLTLPRELSGLDPKLRQLIQQRLSRGTLNVAVSYRLGGEALAEHRRIDQAAALAVAAELEELRTRALESGIALPPVDMAQILAVPGVILSSESAQFAPLEPMILQALEQALDELDASRLMEGKRLQDDLLARGKVMSELVEAIASRGDEAVISQKQRLHERLSVLGLELDLNDERLLKELAFYAERADITEETVRLRSHLVQLDKLLHSEEDPGRSLDFLGQEMSREINTLSAKTADQAISQYALILKGEIGRVREQVMNIE